MKKEVTLSEPPLWVSPKPNLQPYYTSAAPSVYTKMQKSPCFFTFDLTAATRKREDKAF